MGRLDDKTLIVTGAASGIGRACAKRFLEEGANVVLGDVNEAAGNALAASLGERAAFQILDVTREVDWEDAVATALSRWGHLDGVANVAGIAMEGDDVEHCTEQTWDRVIGVNLDGVFLGTKHGVAAMKEDRGGSIVNISSVDCLVSDPNGGAIAYTASKGGVRLLSKSAALHCARHGYGIRVNTIHPGPIQTPMTQAGWEGADTFGDAEFVPNDSAPLGRYGKPEEVAYGALYLASDESSYVTGAELIIDGGYMAQ